MGVKQPVPWVRLFPKATKKAINLLGCMLVLNPAQRITVEQALVHPFLNKYHDPDDEPICVPAFNFDFEKSVGPFFVLTKSCVFLYFNAKKCSQNGFYTLIKPF